MNKGTVNGSMLKKAMVSSQEKTEQMYSFISLQSREKASNP